MSGSGTMSSPTAPGGDGTRALPRKRGRKRVKVSDGAEGKPEKLPSRQQTEKEKDILQYITDRDPTEEELDRIVKNLRDRLGRAYIRADHKRLKNLEPEINANLKDMCGQMKDMREDLKGMKDENKVMGAKLETVQKENKNLSEALQNVKVENKMYQMVLKAATGMSPQDLGIGILDVPHGHGGFMIQDPMNMGNRIHGNPQPQGGPLNQYPMNMGNQMQIMPPVRANQHVGFGMGQTPISGFGQLQLPVGNQHTGTESQGFGMEQNPISSFSATPSTSGVMQAMEEFEIIQRQCQMSEGQFWPGTYEKGGTSAEAAPNSQGHWKFP